ncbi:pseudouridine synthase [Chytriomyces sp. MP71]|nr:pseudouridine synthase [Chytriomyces sp. MP71]
MECLAFWQSFNWIAMKIAVLYGFCSSAVDPENAVLSAVAQCSGGEEVEGESDEVTFGAISRAAGTSRGEFAVRQVLSFEVRSGTISLPSANALNAVLPQSVRVFKVLKVDKSFSARRMCELRTFEYLIPTYVFAPPPSQTGFPFRSDAAYDAAAVIVDSLDPAETNIFASLKRKSSGKKSQGSAVGSSNRENAVSDPTLNVATISTSVSPWGETHNSALNSNHSLPSPKLSEQTLSSSFGKVLTFFGGLKKKPSGALKEDEEDEHAAASSKDMTENGNSPIPLPSVPRRNSVDEGRASSKSTSLLSPLLARPQRSQSDRSPMPAGNTASQTKSEAPPSPTTGGSMFQMFRQPSRQNESPLPQSSQPPTSPTALARGLLVVSTPQILVPTKPIYLHPTTEEDKAALKQYRITPYQLESIKIILQLYCGTHDWHNYVPAPATPKSNYPATSPLNSSQDDTSRFMRIVSATCTPPTIQYGMEWIRIEVSSPGPLLAQAQFRRMMAMLILLVRTNAPRSIVSGSFGRRRMDLPAPIPAAPVRGSGVCNVEFGKWNEVVGRGGSWISFEDDIESYVEGFAEGSVRDEVYIEEEDSMEFEAWMKDIDRNAYLYRHFLNARGVIS